MSKIALDKDGRLLTDVRGAQVELERPGCTYIGDVTDCFYDAAGNALLRVRHFSGEPWPFTPLASEVDVLDRAYDRPWGQGAHLIDPNHPDIRRRD